MGNGKLIRLSNVEKGSVDISIHDNGINLMLDIRIADKNLQQKHSFQCKLQDMPAYFSPDVLRELADLNFRQISLQTPTATNDFHFVQKQDMGVDWFGMTEKTNGLGFYCSYRKGELVRYKSTLDTNPSEWYTKNRQAPCFLSKREFRHRKGG
ncbi:hypothetical protein HQ45_03045 [Porphyromonas crevioricanis]|uniref:Uncharacterized protein n=3 Tax=Porphyromonas crevioricanis TaxID=393921 RepID=A0AB34PH14_9PORP|nr:hypothetical protein [Porphyromonas crevioricanis]KGN90417.1 hypothetical protein HQ45_03045 [Porphyromonas crevioricanis]KGN96763.1 hypothetical protein HQ38_00295 [Porphyromonas crevioricanis]